VRRAPFDFVCALKSPNNVADWDSAFGITTRAGRGLRSLYLEAAGDPWGPTRYRSGYLSVSAIVEAIKRSSPSLGSLSTLIYASCYTARSVTDKSAYESPQLYLSNTVVLERAESYEIADVSAQISYESTRHESVYLFPRLSFARSSNNRRLWLLVRRTVGA
jgi:hypothetical protein